LFIIYVPSQELQGQLQTQRSILDTSNYIVDKHDIKRETNYKQALREENINTEKVKKKLSGFSPLANYTDRAIAAGQRS
jgi:hypothetical protein